MSDVNIVNIALHRLGTERINALTDNNKRAKLMNDIYEMVRRQVLETGMWTFSLKRVTLSTVVSTPDFGYNFAYQLPSDCIAISYEESDYEFKKEGTLLLSDESQLEIVYVRDISDTSQFSALFKKALALSLAVEGTYSITQNSGLRESLLAELEIVISDARTYDSRNTKADDYEIDTFTNSRW